MTRDERIATGGIMAAILLSQDPWRHSDDPEHVRKAKDEAVETATALLGRTVFATERGDRRE
jgi:hypothetical protein